MIKSIGITVIIDEIKSETQARLITDQLLNVFPEKTIPQSMEKYAKFPNAFKLEYLVPVSEIRTKEKLIYSLLQLAESIANPWTVYIDGKGNNTELIFNRDENSKTTLAVFSHIRWAHLQLMY